MAPADLSLLTLVIVKIKCVLRSRMVSHWQPFYVLFFRSTGAFIKIRVTMSFKVGVVQIVCPLPTTVTFLAESSQVI